MVGPPRIMAGKIGIRLDRPRGERRFTGPPPADKDRHPAKTDEDLRGSTCYRIRDDFGAEHLDVPVGRRPRVLTDDVDMIEFERWITHRLRLVCVPDGSNARM